VSGTVTDTSCGVFSDLGGLDPDAINRFIVGKDTQPRALTTAEAAAELGDPFATLVLLKGTFPRTGEAVMEALKAAAPAGDPLGTDVQSFVLGEGSQLPAGASAGRGMRFVVATGGTGPDGPDVIISVFDPARGDVELMAWDRVRGGFNYYRTVGDEAAWVHAGNSRHALTGPTQGKGPFESHASGAMVMKELKIPWNNWKSFEADVDGMTVFGAGNPRGDHPWFTGAQGAENCEVNVAIPAIERWGRARFDQIVADGGTIADPGRILLQVLDTPTVNLVSSRAESQDPGAGGVTLPASFFVSEEALVNTVGLQGPPAFTVPTDIYNESLRKFEFALDDGNGFHQDGDTHFAFFVPERALEDDVALREALRIGLLTPRLAAALLMVDFPNPIYSGRRRRLLDRVPTQAVLAGGASTFSQDMADAILAAAPGSPKGSPEREFADRWAAGKDFTAPFNALLVAYYTAIAGRVTTQDGFDAYVRLAESRRRQAKLATPIVREFPLLFPRTNVPDAARSMRLDGTVLEA
jgi:hypothetical protein